MPTGIYTYKKEESNCCVKKIWPPEKLKHISDGGLKPRNIKHQLINFNRKL